MGKAGRGPQVNSSGQRGGDLLNSDPQGKSGPACLDWQPRSWETALRAGVKSFQVHSWGSANDKKMAVLSRSGTKAQIREISQGLWEGWKRRDEGTG